MKNGYQILWTDHALREFKITVEFLAENWTEKELKNSSFKFQENTKFNFTESLYFSSI